MVLIVVVSMKEVTRMDNVESFWIQGTKKLIFRREGEEYITFNPEDLEFLQINEVGAMILFLISRDFNLDEIINFFAENYKKNKDDLKAEILVFLRNYECNYLISDILGKLNFGD